MTPQQAKKRIEELNKEISYHNNLYYKAAQPEISDFEYDLLKQELESLEKHFPAYFYNSSPTNTVGDDRLDGFSLYQHRQAMLSLNNTYNKDELYEFYERLIGLVDYNELSLVVEPKIDGVAVSLTYENGHFVRGVTRGNGIEGDDVTHNILTIKNLPLKIDVRNCPDFFEIRGEVYLTIEDFSIINTQREAEGLPLFANPRNLAAGSLKLLDPKQAEKRNLKILLYGIGYVHPENFFTHQMHIHPWIKHHSFPCLSHTWLANNFDELWEAIESLKNLRTHFPYQTDGAVIKLNNIQDQRNLGYTAKSPRWAIAYKFQPNRAQTKLKSITIQVGRTGVLTPVAELEPVLLDGSTISRATLHNADEIQRKDIREGDIVEIEKAGDVIPAICKVVNTPSHTRNNVFLFPIHCPACGNIVQKNPNEVFHRCMNLLCPPQVRGRIEHFCSKSAMNIENMGEAVIDSLINHSLITTISDIYKLQEIDLIELPNFGKKSAHNLIQSIQKSKSNELWRLIHGLGIPHVGIQSAKDLTKRFITLDNLMNASTEALESIYGIGEVVAKSVFNFFRNEHTIKLLIELQSLNLNFGSENDITITKNSTLKDKSFVITGTLNKLTRDQAVELIEQAGGRVSNSVTKNTDYLLLGENPGSKLLKANQLNIKILDEPAFIELLNH